MLGSNDTQYPGVTQAWINSRLVLLRDIAQTYFQRETLNQHCGHASCPNQDNLTSLDSNVLPERSKLPPMPAIKLLKELEAILWAHKNGFTRPWEEIEGLFKRLDQQLYSRMRERKRENIRGLYVIIDPQLTNQRNPLKIAEAALRGGAKLLQLREKTYPHVSVHSLTTELKKLCVKYDALFIVNDYPELAVTGSADGLHVGQQDTAITWARHILHPLQIVGRSNSLYDEALTSDRMGADYLAIGSIYPTTSKNEARQAGIATLRKVKEASSHPVVAIGGITENNIHEVIEAGADAVCVLSAIGLSPDPEATTRILVQSIHTVKTRR